LYNRRSLLPSGDIWMMRPRARANWPPEPRPNADAGLPPSPGHKWAQAPGMGWESATVLLILVMMRQVITVIDPATFDAAEFLI